MNNQDLSDVEGVQGFIGACLVDSESGMIINAVGGGALDMEVAGAANTDVVKAKLRAMRDLGLDDAIEDILITLGKQYHLIRPLASEPSVFIYLAIDRATANLALARVALRKADKTISG
ncbi:hypothetical protein SAMN06273572_1011040 [Monaibacterium marinum]|uniref:Roadblock/LC7 domain-containing protein n=1 Tax=Pontivivens marinum TaxID=1690039 RepID=A0A2C9CPQ8_9RHOB|nr:hypothetical protein [Monaibacterium marinum]SOH93185.1 hypothetical protein SAMN06273572_1011040 [Monaibacterium marinum]